MTTPDSNKTVGCSIVFLNSSREVLLLLRDDKETIPFPNHWDLPGGKVEAGETPAEGIRREMMEEIEYDIGVPRLFKVYDFPDRIEHTYWKHADLDLDSTPLHEGQRLAWFSEASLLGMSQDEIAFGFREVLLEFLQSRHEDP